MEKGRIILLTISLMIVLSACSRTVIPDQDETPEIIGTSDELSNVATHFYEDDNYFYSKELIEFSKLDLSLETGIVDIKLSDGEIPAVTHIDDEYNLYTFIPSTDGSGDYYELGRYNLLTEEYKAIVTLKESNSFGFILCVDSKYVIWKEVISEGRKQSSSIYLYNKSEDSNIKIYSDKINPETGSIYVLDSNPAVLSDNIVFFDTVTGYGNDGTIGMDILSYDIVSGDITTVAKMAKRPIRYLDGIAYLRKNEDNSSSLYSFTRGREAFIADLDENIADYTFIDDILCKSINNYEDPNEGKLHVNSTSFYPGEESIPLIEGKQSNYTYGVHSNGAALIWEVTNPEKPVYYDIVNDRFVQLDKEEKRLYSAFAGQDFVIFLYRSDNDGTNNYLHYILIYN